MNSDPTPSEKIKSLIGAEVGTIQLGYDVFLTFDGGQNRNKKYAELHVNVPFQLEDGQHSVEINPDKTDTLASILPLIHATITNITYTDDQTISVAFSTGHHFTVNPVPKYEAWTLNGDDLGFYIAVGV